MRKEEEKEGRREFQEVGTIGDDLRGYWSQIMCKSKFDQTNRTTRHDIE
jgi:hypothetical protein